MFPSTGSLRRAYRPAYGGACGRYAAGEGTTPCWAAAARQGGARGAGRREHARVARSAEGGFPGVLPLAVRGKFTLTRVKLRSTLSSNRGSWAVTSRLSRERPAASVVIRCGLAAPRTGPQQRPGAATVGRGGGANGRQCCRRIRGARLDWRPRMAVTWSFKAAGLACAVCAGLAGLLIVKSGPRQQCRLCRQAKAELRPQGPFPQIITSRRSS